MMLLGKAALGLGGALVLAGAYTFREGLIRVDVDESRAGGSHVHLWVPAALVPMAMHFVPMHDLCGAAQHAREVLPAIHAFANELKKLPEVDLIEVSDGEEHARFRTRSGNLQVDVDSADEHVHLRVPLSTLDDVVGQLEESAPGA
jgi:hypothetical protein